MFYQYPAWSLQISNHYWHLRAARAFNAARVRKEYRKIAVAKKRLHAAGVDMELLRLLCRHMVNLDNKRAAANWWTAYHQSLQKPLFEAA